MSSQREASARGLAQAALVTLGIGALMLAVGILCGIVSYDSDHALPILSVAAYAAPAPGTPASVVPQLSLGGEIIGQPPTLLGSLFILGALVLSLMALFHALRRAPGGNPDTRETV